MNAPTDDANSAHLGPLSRVIAAATRVPTHAPAALASLAGQASEVVSAARNNRGMLADLVRIEVERGVAALGMVTPTDFVALKKRVSELERQVERLSAELARYTNDVPASNAPAAPSMPRTATAKKTAQKAVKKKAVAKKAQASRVVKDTAATGPANPVAGSAASPGQTAAARTRVAPKVAEPVDTAPKRVTRSAAAYRSTKAAKPDPQISATSAGADRRSSDASAQPAAPKPTRRSL